MALDLTERHLAEVRRVVEEILPGAVVWAFGSRIDGRAKPHSDLDIAIVGEAPLDGRRLAALTVAFSESDLPFRVDIVDLAATTPSFRALIERRHEVIGPAPR